MNRSGTDIKQKQEAFRRFARNYPKQIAALGTAFFKESFRRQGWLDESLDAWKPRKSDKNKRDRQRKILVKSARLKRSVQARTNGISIRWGSDVPYAQIHNEGGTIAGEVRVRQHKRRRYKKEKVSRTNLKTRRTSSRTERIGIGETTVKSHTRKMNVTIPQRRYMGKSAKLKEQMDKFTQDKLKEIL